VVDVGFAGLCRSFRRRPPAAAACRLHDEDVAGEHGYVDLFRLEFAFPPLGQQSISMRLPVVATENSERAVMDTVAGGVGDRWTVGLHSEAKDRARSAAESAVAERIGTELVMLEEKRKACLGDLDRSELGGTNCLPFARGLP